MSVLERANRALASCPELVSDLAGPGPVLGAEVVGTLRRPSVVVHRLDTYAIERVEWIRVSPSLVRALADQEV